jgi:hypothetical protein
MKACIRTFRQSGSIAMKADEAEQAARLTLSLTAQASLGRSVYTIGSWSKGELPELKCMGLGNASPHCVSWRNRMILIALS